MTPFPQFNRGQRVNQDPFGCVADTWPQTVAAFIHPCATPFFNPPVRFSSKPEVKGSKLTEFRIHLVDIENWPPAKVQPQRRGKDPFKAISPPTGSEEVKGHDFFWNW